MSWSKPEPGLVIRYAYVWEREAAAGREEGVKDRPCAIILVAKTDAGGTRVQVLPITHAPPINPANAVEIPASTKVRLRLDGTRSWIVLTELNEFIWPGPDLRPLPGAGAESVALGLLPPRFFELVRDRYLELDRSRRARHVRRTD